MKKLCVVLAIAVVITTGMAYRTHLRNDALVNLCRLSQEEIRILTYEVGELERKPSYEQGYKDALIKSGGPNNGGLYQEGWDDAQKIYLSAGYVEGYHNCISQFGFQKPNTVRYLAPEEKKDSDEIVKVDKQ